MKTILRSIFAAVFLFAGLAQARDIQLGDDYQAVIGELGKPVGYMVINNTKYLYYPRGTVTISNDVVTASKLMTSEDWTAHLEDERLAREQRAREAVMRKAKRIEDGLALREKMLNNPQFTEAPVAKRVALWRQFMKRYPEVKVPDQYAEDLRLYELELAVRNEELEQEQKRNELEQRVKRAEARADYAALRASQAESRAREVEQKQSSFGTRYEMSYNRPYPYAYYPYAYYSLYPSRKKRDTHHGHSYPRREIVYGKNTNAWTYQYNQRRTTDRAAPERDRYAPLSFGDRGGYENDSLSFGSGRYYRGR